MQRTRTAGFLLACLAVSRAAASPIDFVDQIPGTFIDISGTGTNLHLHGEDEAEITTTIGNGLLPAGRVVVANNGGIAFDPPDTNLPPDNEPLRIDDAFGGGQALFAYWDDIGNDVGGVFFQEQGDVLIVQWQGRSVGLGNEPRATFQIQIFAPSEATTPYFQFLYRSINAVGGGASATIGYQDGGAGFNDELWSFNTPGAVADGTVLTVLPEPASLIGLGLAALLSPRRAK